MAAKDKSKTRQKDKSGKRTKGIDQRLVKALAHELRVEILTILNERMASPNELSKELDEGLSQVSYHVKVLKDYECIKMVKTAPRRGAVEHYYQATSKPFITDRDWHELPDSVRPGLSADLFELIRNDVVRAMLAGTFDERKDRHMSRILTILDQQGWDEMRDALEATLKEVEKIQKKASTRLAKSGEEGFVVSASILGFEVPGPGEEEKKATGSKSKGGRAAKGRAKGGSKKRR